MSKYSKGARAERSLIHTALASGATLAIRGAGSKSYAHNPDLKVDMVLFKDGFCYLVQSKKQEKLNNAERQRFFDAAVKEKLHGKYFYVKALYVESKEDLEMMMAGA